MKKTFFSLRPHSFAILLALGVATLSSFVLRDQIIEYSSCLSSVVYVENNSLYIKVDKDISQIEAVLSNAQGISSVLINKRMSRGSHEISLKRYSGVSGVYFLKVAVDYEIITFKLICANGQFLPTGYNDIDLLENSQPLDPESEIAIINEKASPAIDFNGDQKADIAKYWPDPKFFTADVHLSSGLSFSSQRWATSQGGYWPQQKWFYGDFNGDGKTDMIKVWNSNGSFTSDVHISTGGSFELQRWATNQGGYWEDQKWFVGDFTGDGKTDMMKLWNDGGQLTCDVHISTGSKFNIQRWATKQGPYLGMQKWFIGDFNGDGKSDLMSVWNDNGQMTSNVHVSTGSNFDMQRWATQQGGYWDAQNWVIGDFNGDGKTDLLKYWNDSGEFTADVHVSNGSSFMSIEHWAIKQGGFWESQKWGSGDFNGDGKEDLIKVWNDNGTMAADVHISKGTSFELQRWATNQGGFWKDQKWSIDDFNGDGKDDIMKIWNDEGEMTSDVHLSTGSSFSAERWATKQGGYWREQEWLTRGFFTKSAGNLEALRNSKVVSTLYSTDEIVVSDFDLDDYDIDKTGTTDVTAIIQRAIDDCNTNGGGTVWIPAGNYRVTGTILIKPFVTLQGDWNNPDGGESGYGTVIYADVPPGEGGATIFKIGGSAAAVGLTVFYPNQNASHPVAYNYTFEIPGNAWNGAINYHASTIKNVTLLNSYKGICISASPSDVGGSSASHQVHELSTIVNVKGTCLHTGMVSYNSADVDTYEWINFDNSYWINAGSQYNKPDRATLDNWTRTHGTGFIFGDLEWMQGTGLQASNYLIGMKIVSGLRAQFSGEFAWVNLKNCNVALQVENIDTRWGMLFSRSVFEGNIGSNPLAIKKTISKGNVKFIDGIITGGVIGSGISISNPGSPESYKHSYSQVRKPFTSVLHDVTASPYNADKTGVEDVSEIIQSALDYAGGNGGGIVYMPAGQYKIKTHLSVPAGVELRGACNAPNRDTPGLSMGTIIKAYEGHNSTNPDSDPACITLQGNGAGIRGIRFWYPNNNLSNGVAQYPFSIRGSGNNQYAIYCGFVNSYNGIIMSGSNHYVKRVWGTCLRKGVVISGGNGYVESCLFNPNFYYRTGFSNWLGEESLSTIRNFLKDNLTAFEIFGSNDENLLNIFSFSAHTFLYNHGNSNTTLFNGGHDGGSSTNSVVNISGSCTVVNHMMYWNSGSATYGSPSMYNFMYLK